MGRTTNLINGVISGKVGAQVGYKLQNDKQPQGVRAYQPIVHNPKTYAQAAHRAKIRPAQLFYTAFEPILNHAFLPAGSRGKNRFRFLSLAYRNPVIPRVLKGENNIPYNVPYKVSEGDLPLSMYVTNSALLSHSEYLCFNIQGFEGITDSVSDVSNAVINNNPGIVDGDEITSIALVLTESGVFPDIKSFVLNTTDTLNDTSYLQSGKLSLWGNFESTSFLMIYTGATKCILAAALIISRRTGDTFHYTNSFLCMSQYAIDNLAPTEQAVVESYMSPGGQLDSSLILQQAQQANTAPRITGAEMIDFSAKSGYDIGDFDYQQLTFAIFSDGFKKIVVNNSGQILVSDHNGADYIMNFYGTDPALLSMTTLDGSPTILLSEVQAAGFLLHEIG